MKGSARSAIFAIVLIALFALSFGQLVIPKIPPYNNLPSQPVYEDNSYFPFKEKPDIEAALSACKNSGTCAAIGQAANIGNNYFQLPSDTNLTVMLVGNSEQPDVAVVVVYQRDYTNGEIYNDSAEDYTAFNMASTYGGDKVSGTPQWVKCAAKATPNTVALSKPFISVGNPYGSQYDEWPAAYHPDVKVYMLGKFWANDSQRDEIIVNLIDNINTSSTFYYDCAWQDTSTYQWYYDYATNTYWLNLSLPQGSYPYTQVVIDVLESNLPPYVLDRTFLQAVPANNSMCSDATCAIKVNDTTGTWIANNYTFGRLITLNLTSSSLANVNNGGHILINLSAYGLSHVPHISLRYTVNFSVAKTLDDVPYYYVADDNSLWIKVNSSLEGAAYEGYIYYNDTAGSPIINRFSPDDVFVLYDDFNDGVLNTSKWMTSSPDSGFYFEDVGSGKAVCWSDSSNNLEGLMSTIMLNPNETTIHTSLRSGTGGDDDVHVILSAADNIMGAIFGTYSHEVYDFWLGDPSDASQKAQLRYVEANEDFSNAVTILNYDQYIEGTYRQHIIHYGSDILYSSFGSVYKSEFPYSQMVFEQEYLYLVEDSSDGKEMCVNFVYVTHLEQPSPAVGDEETGTWTINGVTYTHRRKIVVAARGNESGEVAFPLKASDYGGELYISLNLTAAYILDGDYVLVKVPAYVQYLKIYYSSDDGDTIEERYPKRSVYKVFDEFDTLNFTQWSGKDIYYESTEKRVKLLSANNNVRAYLWSRAKLDVPFHLTAQVSRDTGGDADPRFTFNDKDVRNLSIAHHNYGVDLYFGDGSSNYESTTLLRYDGSNLYDFSPIDNAIHTVSLNVTSTYVEACISGKSCSGQKAITNTYPSTPIVFWESTSDGKAFYVYSVSAYDRISSPESITDALTGNWTKAGTTYTRLREISLAPHNGYTTLVLPVSLFGGELHIEPTNNFSYSIPLTSTSPPSTYPWQIDTNQPPTLRVYYLNSHSTNYSNNGINLTWANSYVHVGNNSRIIVTTIKPTRGKEVWIWAGTLNSSVANKLSALRLTYTKYITPLLGTWDIQQVENLSNEYLAGNTSRILISDVNIPFITVGAVMLPKPTNDVWVGSAQDITLRVDDSRGGAEAIGIINGTQAVGLFRTVYYYHGGYVKDAAATIQALNDTTLECYVPAYIFPGNWHNDTNSSQYMGWFSLSACSVVCNLTGRITNITAPISAAALTNHQQIFPALFTSSHVNVAFKSVTEYVCNGELCNFFKWVGTIEPHTYVSAIGYTGQPQTLLAVDNDTVRFCGGAYAAYVEKNISSEYYQHIEQHNTAAFQHVPPTYIPQPATDVPVYVIGNDDESMNYIIYIENGNQIQAVASSLKTYESFYIDRNKRLFLRCSWDPDEPLKPIFLGSTSNAYLYIDVKSVCEGSQEEIPASIDEIQKIIDYKFTSPATNQVQLVKWNDTTAKLTMDTNYTLTVVYLLKGQVFPTSITTSGKHTYYIGNSTDPFVWVKVYHDHAVIAYVMNIQDNINNFAYGDQGVVLLMFFTIFIGLIFVTRELRINLLISTAAVLFFTAYGVVSFNPQLVGFGIVLTIAAAAVYVFLKPRS